MPKQVQLRRGTTVQHATFTGAVGEVTVDTTKKVPVVHDGTTAGGTPCAKESALTAVESRLNGFAVVNRASDGAIAQYALVKMGSDASHVAPAATVDSPYGVALDAAAGAGVAVRVALLSGGCEAPLKMISNAAISAGALLEASATAGKVQTLTGSVGTHHVIGRALSAAGAADVVMDVMPMYFLRVV